jgi:hypothetical protein
VTTIFGRIIIALLLFVIAWLVGRVALIEDLLASAETDLATLQPEAADAEYAGIVAALGMAARLPFVGESLSAEMERERAMVAYWRGDYAAVPSEEAELTASDAGADLLFLAANARFRTVVGKRLGQEGAQDLDGVLRLYTMVLKKDPFYPNVAFDYEYVVRLRNIVAKTPPRDQDGNDGTADRDQPPPPSVHGEQGSPPADTPPDQFNVIVPLRPEERGELMKAGAGAGRQRKG